MARSSTTLKPGNQLALKHGAYSAARRLDYQNAAITEARHRMKEGKLTPLEQDCYELLASTKADLAQVSDWLDKNGGPLTPRGKVRDAQHLKLALIKSTEVQVIQLWKMLLAVPADQQLDVDEARAYLDTTYGHTTPPITPPTSGVAAGRAAQSPAPAAPDLANGSVSE